MSDKLTLGHDSDDSSGPIYTSLRDRADVWGGDRL